MKISVLYDKYFLKLTAEALETLKVELPDVTISYCGNNDSVCLEDVIESEVIFGKPPPAMIKDLKNLKWLHLPSAGADPYVDKSLYADPLPLLTKSSGTFGIPISEYVLGMMVTLSHNFVSHHKNQLSGDWRQIWLETYDIFDSNVLVLGLGDIGTEVCRRLSGFGCRVIGFRNDPNVPHELVDEVRPLSQFRDSLPEADYVIVCLPGTEETRSLIGREEFGLMKKRAIIVNVGRGYIIDTDALIDALNSGKIAGAGLDVTEPEPLPKEHPLWNAKNALITPHVSAFTSVPAQRRFAIFKDLLKRYISGQELFNIVDFKSGY